MCQLCTIKARNASERWPKPLEPSIQNLELLIDVLHADFTAYQKPKITFQAGQALKSKRTTLPRDLLDNARLFRDSIQQLEESLEEWWASPAKRAQRKSWTEGFQQAKLTALHKVNNAASARISEMEAKLGVFLRYGLGVERGVAGLDGVGVVGGGKRKMEWEEGEGRSARKVKVEDEAMYD